jgi:formylglycine-generating enzyme required for sulfatase activity
MIIFKCIKFHSPYACLLLCSFMFSILLFGFSVRAAATLIACDELCNDFSDDSRENFLEECSELCLDAQQQLLDNQQLPVSEQPDEMVRIHAGVFHSGCLEECSIIEYVEYKEVRGIITRDFYIDQFEVTQKEFEDVMGTNPSYYTGKKCGANCPVESVTWNQARDYCEAVGKRLPTAAEWEYAARANTLTRHYWGNEINTDHLWYNDDSGKRPKPVGLKQPNPFGLYDMEGNIFEWVQDCNYFYIGANKSVRIQDRFGQDLLLAKSFLVDPVFIRDDCHERILKGGSFNEDGKTATPYYNQSRPVDEQRGDQGFRCAMDVYDTDCE